MTLEEAKAWVAKLAEEHPDGCSCGSPDCLCDPFGDGADDLEYEQRLAAIVRDQTDWPSPRCLEKREWCREHSIPCI